MKTLNGTIIKRSGDKTVRVRVVEKVAHPKYKKIYTRHKDYLVHDEKNTGNVDDTVSIMSGKPVSKKKSWYLITE